MRLILIDLPAAKRYHFYPLALSRPIWELRCGMTLAGREAGGPVRGDRRGLLRAAVHGRGLRGADGLAGQRPREASPATTCCCVHGRVKADGPGLSSRRPQPGGLDADGEVLAAWIGRSDLARLEAGSLEALLASAQRGACRRPSRLPRGTTPGTWCWPTRSRLRADFRRRRPQRHRGHGRAARRHPRQPQGRVRRPRGAGPPDGRDRRRARPGLHRRRGRDPSLHADRGPVLHRQEVDPAGRQVPRGQLDRPDVPRRRRGRGVDHPRLLEQVPRRLPRPRLRRRVGQPRRADDQQRPEERLLQRVGDARRPHADRHRLDQGRRADRRPHQDLDRHAVEHRGLRGGDGADRGHRQAAAQVHPLLRLVPGGRGDQGLRQAEAVRDGRAWPWAAASASGPRPTRRCGTRFSS